MDAFLQQFLYDPRNPLLFSNGFFVYFFAVFISLYYALRNTSNGRSILVSAFSLYFFYKASGSFVLVVIMSAVFNYLMSARIAVTRNALMKKYLLWASVAVNLGILFYFKYTNFFIALTNDVAHTHIGLLHILLPIGISFFTFENISYSIDIYKGEFEPEKKFVNYLLFLSFFPKLVMGPIVRAKDFIPQLYKPYHVSQEDFTKGFYLIFSGLFKKLIIADFLTLNLVDVTFNDPSLYTGLQCLVAVFAYAMVIYCDFSGYSDVARGIAKWMGIDIMPNFLSPYQSRSVTEFWSRWHISLSSWLKDYLYIFSLGGNRKGKMRTNVNLLLTMVLGGFWHGAKWTFIVWGLLHGMALIVHKLWQDATKERLVRVNGTAWYGASAQVLTFLFVCFCWVFFKADNFEIATKMLSQIAFNFSPQVWPEFAAHYSNVLWVMALGFVLHMIPDSFPDTMFERFLQRAPMYAYFALFGLFIFVYAQQKAATPVMPIYLQF